MTTIDPEPAHPPAPPSPAKASAEDRLRRRVEELEGRISALSDRRTEQLYVSIVENLERTVAWARWWVIPGGVVLILFAYLYLQWDIKAMRDKLESAAKDTETQLNASIATAKAEVATLRSEQQALLADLRNRATELRADHRELLADVRSRTEKAHSDVKESIELSRTELRALSLDATEATSSAVDTCRKALEQAQNAHALAADLSRDLEQRKREADLLLNALKASTEKGAVK